MKTMVIEKNSENSSSSSISKNSVIPILESLKGIHNTQLTTTFLNPSPVMNTTPLSQSTNPLDSSSPLFPSVNATPSSLSGTPTRHHSSNTDAGATHSLAPNDNTDDEDSDDSVESFDIQKNNGNERKSEYFKKKKEEEREEEQQQQHERSEISMIAQNTLKNFSKKMFIYIKKKGNNKIMKIKDMEKIKDLEAFKRRFFESGREKGSKAASTSSASTNSFAHPETSKPPPSVYSPLIDSLSSSSSNPPVSTRKSHLKKKNTPSPLPVSPSTPSLPLAPPPKKPSLDDSDSDSDDASKDPSSFVLYTSSLSDAFSAQDEISLFSIVEPSCTRKLEFLVTNWKHRFTATVIFMFRNEDYGEIINSIEKIKKINSENMRQSSVMQWFLEEWFKKEWREVLEFKEDKKERRKRTAGQQGSKDLCRPPSSSSSADRFSRFSKSVDDPASLSLHSPSSDSLSYLTQSHHDSINDTISSMLRLCGKRKRIHYFI